MGNPEAESFTPDFQLQRPLYQTTDFTFYHRCEDNSELKLADDLFTRSGSIEIRRGEKHLRGRAIICRCYRGKLLSATVRHNGLKGNASPDRYWDGNIEPFRKQLQRSDWCPQESNDKYPIGIRDICDELRGLLTTDADRLQGLLLVTGATKSAKSEVARGITYLYLSDHFRPDKTRPSRRPHLVTFEDPIERYFQNIPETRDCSLVDYTPRELDRDVGSLKQAVNDALRQTPAAFYIGEVRENDDWEHVLRLAGTGHFVVATAHAGSLVEAMQRVFTAVGADTPVKRGIYADRLLGVVHQRLYSVEGEKQPTVNEQEEPKEVVLPALWRKSPLGVAALVSDGLSSILPNSPAESERDHTSSFGRSWFVERFAKLSTFAKFKKSAATKALRDDLTGS